MKQDANRTARSRTTERKPGKERYFNVLKREWCALKTRRSQNGVDSCFSLRIDEEEGVYDSEMTLLTYGNAPQTHQTPHPNEPDMVQRGNNHAMNTPNAPDSHGIGRTNPQPIRNGAREHPQSTDNRPMFRERSKRPHYRLSQCCVSKKVRISRRRFDYFFLMQTATPCRRDGDRLSKKWSG